MHQAGSRVDDETLRFDFTYHGKLSDEMIVKVENMVNDKINTNSDVVTTITDLETAKKMGAMALFEDKYKVLQIADSIELCGGTHVRNTKDIKKFAILSVTNKGADTYRIEATTDDNIEKLIFNYIKPYNDEIIDAQRETAKLQHIDMKEIEKYAALFGGQTTSDKRNAFIFDEGMRESLRALGAMEDDNPNEKRARTIQAVFSISLNFISRSVDGESVCLLYRIFGKIYTG